MKQSVSLTPGHGNIKHNISEEYRNTLTNVDSSRGHRNVVIKDSPLESVYDMLFGDALDAYNLKQTRSDRVIDSYLRKIQTSKQEHDCYEYVAMVGNRDSNPAEDMANVYGSERVYRDFLSAFEKRFPNMKVFHAVIHNDESTPHLHMDYVPVSTGNKRGLETKNSMRGALREMGYEDIRDFNRDSFDLLVEVVHNHGIERVDMGCGRAHLSVRDFISHVNESDYPYTDNPELIKLIIEQQQALEELVEITGKQEVTIQSLVAEEPSHFSVSRLKEEMADAREVAKELNPKLEAIKGMVDRFGTFIREIPERWRDFILNPAPGGHRRVLQEKAECQSSHRQSLSDVAAESRAASEALRNGTNNKATRRDR